MLELPIQGEAALLPVVAEQRGYVLEGLIGFCRIVGLPRWLSGKESTSNAGDTDSIPESGRSPGVENGNLFLYSCLGNPWTEESGGL